MLSWLRELFGGSGSAPEDVAERLAGPFWRVARESTSLSDRETVRRWVRELRPGGDVQVFVHRPWGTLAAASDGKHPIGVVWAEGANSWFARAPGATDHVDLTLEQVEHVVLEALTSSGPPSWPEWHPLG